MKIACGLLLLALILIPTSSSADELWSLSIGTSQWILEPGEIVTVRVRMGYQPPWPAPFEPAVGQPVTVFLPDAALGDLDGSKSVDGITDEDGRFSTKYTAPTGLGSDIDQRIGVSSSVLPPDRDSFTTVTLMAIDALFGSWMYLSTVPDHYECGLEEEPWVSGEKSLYLVLESPADAWTPERAYNGIEFSVDYPPEIFCTEVSSPYAPAPLFFGSRGAGHMSYGMGTGGPVEMNPWPAVQIDFLTLAPVDNLAFLLGPSDTPSSRAHEGPAWALYDAEDPPIIRPEGAAQGSGADHKPTWQAGVVLLNYNPATISPELLSELDERVQSAGHPLWMNAVATETESWGGLKARYAR